MQAESGQQLHAIVARKELERLACNGLFFWGVGNAPARSVSLLVKARQPVDVIFSVMKSKPKQIDTSPLELYVWRRFIDLNGVLRSLPPGVLVTSRGDTYGGAKRRHYALVCHSAAPLVLDDLGPFYPSMYRNVGGTGAPIGASQVTALLKRCADPCPEPGYRINIRAQLTGSYWVRLADPIKIGGSNRALWERRLSSLALLTVSTWREFVGTLRDGGTAAYSSTKHQPSLF
jgi:hypothetical protein